MSADDAQTGSRRSRSVRPEHFYLGGAVHQDTVLESLHDENCRLRDECERDREARLNAILAKAEVERDLAVCRQDIKVLREEVRGLKSSRSRDWFIDLVLNIAVGAVGLFGGLVYTEWPDVEIGSLIAIGLFMSVVVVVAVPLAKFVAKSR